MEFIQIFIFVALILLGYFAGSYFEHRHYKSIMARERASVRLPVVTFKTVPYEVEDIEGSNIVYGSAVISVDYFKRMLASLRNIFGGKVKSYESLIDRARREAILRMKQRAMGSAIVVNMRIETATIGRRANTGKSVGCVEAVAYGTAIKLKKNEIHTKTSQA